MVTVEKVFAHPDNTNAITWWEDSGGPGGFRTEGIGDPQQVMHRHLLAAVADADGDRDPDLLVFRLDLGLAWHRNPGTDPLNPDTDEDGLQYGEELATYDTNPLDEDSDDDGASDGVEVDAGTDPNSASSTPVPEPSSELLIGGALLTLAMLRRRKSGRCAARRP